MGRKVYLLRSWALEGKERRREGARQHALSFALLLQLARGRRPSLGSPTLIAKQNSASPYTHGQHLHHQRWLSRRSLLLSRHRRLALRPLSRSRSRGYSTRPRLARRVGSLRSTFHSFRSQTRNDRDHGSFQRELRTSEYGSVAARLCCSQNSFTTNITTPPIHLASLSPFPIHHPPHLSSTPSPSPSTFDLNRRAESAFIDR